ncbi:MAG: hypothetical protein ABI743_10055 [bacterium]
MTRIRLATLPLLLLLLLPLTSANAAETEEVEEEEPPTEEELAEIAALEAERAELDAAAIAPFADGSGALTLPAGTPLKLKLAESLYSQRNEEGDEVVFTLSEDVVLLGQTYLVAGTPILGRITKASPAKSWGRSGSVHVFAKAIMAPYCNTIPVTDTFSSTERSKTGKTILGIMAFGVIFGGAVKGKKIEIPAGYEMTLFTHADGLIRDIPAEEMRTQVEAWTMGRIHDNFYHYTWNGERNLTDSLHKNGLTWNDADLQITPMENGIYALSLPCGDAGPATFEFAPFDDVHEGGSSYKTLKPTNALAEQIIDEID